MATIPEIEARTREESVELGRLLATLEAEQPLGDFSTHVLEVLHIPARDAQRFMQQSREAQGADSPPGPKGSQGTPHDTGDWDTTAVGEENMLIRRAEGPLHTVFGTFRELLYSDGQQENIALVMGQVERGQEILCRVHSHCLGAHVFNSVECDCREQMALAQALIAHEGRGHGHLALMRSRVLQAQGWSQTEAYLRLGYTADARDYTGATAILRDLGVRSIRLLTNNPQKVEHLQVAGILIAGTHPLAVDPGANERLRRRYAEKAQQGHRIPSAYT
jgi:GTP cyclohydrolase II